MMQHMALPCSLHMLSQCFCTPAPHPCPAGMMAHVSGGKAPDFTQGSVSGLLKDMGYDETMVYKF